MFVRAITAGNVTFPNIEEFIKANRSHYLRYLEEKVRSMFSLSPGADYPSLFESVNGQPGYKNPCLPPPLQLGQPLLLGAQPQQPPPGIGLFGAPPQQAPPLQLGQPLLFGAQPPQPPPGIGLLGAPPQQAPPHQPGQPPAGIGLGFPAQAPPQPQQPPAGIGFGF